MASNKDNIIFEKTSFLQGSNSSFIKELYLKYLDNPKSIPESWVEFFDGLDEDQDTIKKEIVDPYLAPLYDALGDMMPSTRLKPLLAKNTIEVIPLAYMRGRTLNNTFMILDEALEVIDNINKPKIENLFNTLKKRYQHIILITHIDDYFEICDKIIHVKNKKT